MAILHRGDRHSDGDGLVGMREERYELMQEQQAEFLSSKNES